MVLKIKLWIKSEERVLPKIKNPINAIQGIMESLKNKYNSVELQHNKSGWIK